jgi:hypothetical protein
MERLVFEQSEERWVVRDRLARTHLRFERWGEQLQHFLGDDLASLPGEEFTRDSASLVGSCETGAGAPGKWPSPASPVYEEITHRARGDQQQLMLVGRFGSHHYSAVFTAHSEPLGMLIRADVADRCPSEPSELVITYGLKSVLGTPASIEWRRAGWDAIPVASRARWSVEVEAPGRLELVRSSAFGTTLRIRDGAMMSDATRRCRYAWRLLCREA